MNQYEMYNFRLVSEVLALGYFFFFLITEQHARCVRLTGHHIR